MLTRVSIENFKRFQMESFELGGCTLLTGLNGAGKSTVIQVLSLIRQSLESGAISNGTVNLNGRYVQIGTGRDALCENFTNTEDERPYIKFGIEWDGRDANFLMDYQSNADYLNVTPSGNFHESPLATEEYQHIRADRVGPEVLSAHSYEVTVRNRSLGSRGEYAVDRLLESQDEIVSATRRNPRAAGSSLLEQISSWIGEACPGVVLNAHRVQNADLVRLDIGFGGTTGLNSSNRFRPTNVGFGVGYVLPIVVACLTAPRGSILALENPEAHLHPKGQSKIAELVARTVRDGVQVIVESHSDHFLNGLRLAKKNNSDFDVRIHYFDIEKNTSDFNISVDNRGMLTEWPEGFFDESSKTISEILRP